MIDIETLINNGKYSEAAKILDENIAKNNNDRFYYLRSIVSYKLKNYEYACEMLEHALSLKKDSEYLKFYALIKMEILEFADALETLNNVLMLKKNDAEAYFLSAICLMFLDDKQNQECKKKYNEYMKLAYINDPKKTKIMIKEFYLNFFKDNIFLSENDRKALEEKIKRIR
ncbi:MAG: hypothetical protein AB1391_00855 [Candidatus Micrarchaeota archaeon]